MQMTTQSIQPNVGGALVSATEEKIDASCLIIILKTSSNFIIINALFCKVETLIFCKVQEKLIKRNSL